MGNIYRRGKVYWVRYYRNGKQHSESAHSDKKEVAKRLLKLREGEISKGELPGLYFDRVRFEELVEDYRKDYRINQKKSNQRAEIVSKHLTDYFGGMKATQITTALIKEYVDRRMGKGAANGTINRELAALKRMFNLGRQNTPPKVGLVPYIPMLKESNVRKGFFEHEQFVALRNALPYPVNSITTFAYHTGWRKKEILGLTWDRVDLKEGTIYLNPGETKNEDARTLYMDEELLHEMQFLHMNQVKGCSFVFQRDGERVKDFRATWDKACKETKLEGKIFHDFRRTAVRNMIRAGIPERVAMEISGHKTREVFDRYHIVSAEDLKLASRKHQEYLEKQTVLENKYNLGTVGQKAEKSHSGKSPQPLDITPN
jgi:integrase